MDDYITKPFQPEALYEKIHGFVFPSWCKFAKNSPVKRIAILASGAGSNAANIIEYVRSKKIAEVVLIACNQNYLRNFLWTDIFDNVGSVTAGPRS